MRKRHRQLKVPYWIIDGINGILALVIYNFLLFLIRIAEIGGIPDQIEELMGYFGTNLFLKLGFNKPTIMLGVISIFLLAFVLGMSIALMIRIMRREKLKP